MQVTIFLGSIYTEGTVTHFLTTALFRRSWSVRLNILQYLGM